LTKADGRQLTLTDLKGDQEILKKIDDAEELLRSLRKTLSS
jgi:ParB family chromosome partitioning protein